MAKKVPAPPVPQSGVLPYRSSSNGIEVLLITSRSNGTWILPKGNLEAHLTPQEAAAREAWEEAGVEGEVLPDPIFQWNYRKGSTDYLIDLYPMRVSDTFPLWPEHLSRKRKWMSVSKALAKVTDVSLKGLLRTLPRLIEEAEVAFEEAQRASA